MSRIKLMDDILANKIAAGEVVERCASVVKELVENSIDAESTEIKIDLLEAGTKEIKVTDDGLGMDKLDAVECFNRHATSKLKTEQDLFHINTLGFRGEALSSIASVSEVTLKTCEKDIGTLVKINGGNIEAVESCEARKGTTIIVANLFYNTPARLKHMKSLYTELSSITDYVNKIAMSYPNIKFILTNNGTTLLNTDGTDNLLKTISAVYGIDVVRKMVKVESSNEDYSINGYITKPEIHRSSRNGMIVLVNGRVVRNMELNRVINDSYHSYKPDNRYPITVLKIEVDPTLIDVNIHPTKMDIKFSKLNELLFLVEKMIKKALKGIIHIPNVELREEEITDNTVSVKETTKREYVQPILNLERQIEDQKELYRILEEDKKFETPLFKEEITNSLPELYPIGSVLGTYIVCQNEEGMTLIDQHAAKERINYEKIKNRLDNPKKDNIELIVPINIELTNSEFIILKQHFDMLINMGFIIEEFGINSIVIKAHPIWLTIGSEKEMIERIIESIISYEDKFEIGKFNDLLSATLACKMSIKGNTSLTLEEMEHLIDDLRKCNNPYHCPHGRPTMIKYPKQELEKLFKRSGF